MLRACASIIVATVILLGPVAAPSAWAAPATTAGATPAEAALARTPLTATTEDLGLPGVTPPVAQRSRIQARVASAPVVQVAEHKLDAPVGVVGVTLDSIESDAEVYVREIKGGQAGQWTEADLDQAGSVGERKAGTNPIIVSDADAVQVATVSSEPVGAELMLATSARSAVDPSASDLAWADPAILSRSAWGANEGLRREPYRYAEVTGAMIHHTAGGNTYTPEQVPAILRSIQEYHVNGRGWNDIAYNILVDRFGRAWEGRGGGVDKAVQGGHAWSVTNARVFGLSFIGNFDTMQPPAEMLDTAARVIAWKFRLHGVDPNQPTWGSGGQDGGDTTLQAISGHRDENATACPGEHVYARFADIRAAVAKYMAENKPAPQPRVLECRGTLSRITVRGDLHVPRASTCTLRNVTVTGNVTVARMGELNFHDSVIRGNVQATRHKFIRSVGSRIVGDFQVENGGTVTATRLRVGGDAQFKAMGGTVTLGWPRISGNLQWEENLKKRLYVRSGSIGGDIQVKESRHALVGRNVVGGNVQIEKNRGSLYVEGNRISGNLQCARNTYQPTGGNNIVSGTKEGQCRRL